MRCSLFETPTTFSSSSSRWVEDSADSPFTPTADGSIDEPRTSRQVARQLGYGVESVRSWVRQADIDDGVTAGTTTAEAERIKALEQEVRELRRANAILKSASAFFAAELDRPAK